MLIGALSLDVGIISEQSLAKFPHIDIEEK